MRLCTVCKKKKPNNKFYKDNRKNTKDEYRKDCKDCCNSRDKKYKNTNHGKIAHAKSKRKYNKDNKEYLLKQNVRTKTRNKYGRLPEGLEYHHPKPYHEDNFIILTRKEHFDLHRKERRW